MSAGSNHDIETWNRGYESILIFRSSVATELEASVRDVAKIKIDLARAEERVRQNELRLKTVDEMLDSYRGTRNFPEGTPVLLGMGRFSGVDLRSALTTVFEELPGVWFSVPVLKEKIVSQGFDAKIAHLNPSIHAACKRFVDKSYIQTQESKEGRVYRYMRAIDSLNETLEKIGADRILSAPQD